VVSEEEEDRFFRFKSYAVFLSCEDVQDFADSGELVDDFGARPIECSMCSKNYVGRCIRCLFGVF